MTKIEELRAAFEAATPGQIIPRRPYMDEEPDGYMESDLDFMGNNRYEAVDRLEGPLANFIALAHNHNLMPQLLETVERLEAMQRVIGELASTNPFLVGEFEKNKTVLEKLK